MGKKHIKNIDPLGFMLKIMRDPASPVELALEAAKAAAPYVHARVSPEYLTAEEQAEVLALEFSSNRRQANKSNKRKKE